VIEKIIYKKKILALVVRTNKNTKSGVNFVSPTNFGQQVGLMRHKKNHFIEPHIHKKYSRKVFTTSEVLLIKKGLLELIFIIIKKNIYLARF